MGHSKIMFSFNIKTAFNQNEIPSPKKECIIPVVPDLHQDVEDALNTADEEISNKTESEEKENL